MGWSEWKQFGGSIDTLWVNENPASAATITANCNWEEYGLIAVLVSASTEPATDEKTIQCFDLVSDATAKKLLTVQYNGRYDVGGREVSFSEGKIDFTTTRGDYPQWTIPLKVYGIKTDVALCTYP